MLKTVTYEQVLDMGPCWLSTPAGCRRLKRYADRLGGKATALNILRLSSIPASDRLWITLRDEFIPAQYAARACAQAAAKSAAWDTAQAAAQAAVWTATRDAAYAAAMPATYTAERKAQVDMLIDMLLEASQ